jgi:cyclic beta-1,2-glucan synthetase
MRLVRRPPRHPTKARIAAPTLAPLLRRLRATPPSAADELLAGPIRGEPLGADHLGGRAIAIAQEQRLAPLTRRRRAAPLLARLRETARLLEDAHARLVDYAARDGDVGPAGDWLLDNFHVVQEHIREVRESLPRGYYRELPELAEGPLAGYPRVYELAITLISHTEGRVDLENVELFVRAFQEISPLSIGELWAVPAMLRLGCLESVRRMTLRTVQRLQELEDADRWAERIEDASDEGPRALARTLEAFVAAPPSLGPVLVARLLQQVRPLRGAHASLVHFEQWLGDEAMSGEDAAARATQRVALTQLMMGNSITSLRAITHADWRIFVEHQSEMEAALRDDAAGFYAGMTFTTRDTYRHAVERVAKRTRTPEVVVARRAVELGREAAAAAPEDTRRTHVGYWLVGDGLAVLEQERSYRPWPSEVVPRWVRGHANIVFVGGVLLGTVSMLAAVLALAGPAGREAWLLVLLLALVPASDVAVAIVNQLVTAFLPPRRLPKLDLDAPHGIPPALRTAVVVPTLFGSVEAVEEALEHLEVQYLANRDACLHFALLGDFTDADTELRPDDAAILAAADRGVRELNARYAPATDDAFFLFHRARRWNAQQGTWMGWERKRGKLGEFNRFVRGLPGAADAFVRIVGRTTALREVRYVITLDGDTVLPPGAARLLVGTIAHPLNRAGYDPASGRVTEGYGILQPRVGVSLPSAHRSRFAAIHSGHPGVDPYTTAVSDVYQDLYGEGSFTGKGIYDVAAFEQATHGRFAENTLLSHDLIEGGYARAGLATDVVVYDDYPASYLSYTRRKRRWIRGDWQLLRWLMPTVPGPDGPEPNTLSLLTRWKIFDNLRRSTLEIALFALIVAGWTILPGSPLRWTLLVVGLLAAPWIVALALALLRPPIDRSWTAYYRAVGHDAAVSAQQVALALAFLPHQAWVSADAIVRTVWRVAVSRRHLLEWQSSARAEHETAGLANGERRAMWPALVLVGVLLPVVAWFAWATLRTAAPVDAPWGPVVWLALAVMPLSALWLASPAIARALAAPAPVPERRLTAEQRGDALRYARLHWAYFDRFAGDGTHWLAPDNYQDDPSPVLAMRTSPTNIGLQLLATVSARDLGFIDAEGMTQRLEQTFGTMERLRRYEGHWYNWYDLHDLRVLEPAYVSTVDSGNLAGHLLAVRQACLGIVTDVPEAAPLAGRLAALAAQALAWVLAMDFRFLFDDERKLFAIGYHEASHTRDASHYDLLASEARLASFVAIAKHDVPVDHWFHLDRTLTRTGGATALVSWSGSMFEYLMPTLVMRALPFTVLAQTQHGAVQRQVAFGAARNVPWGVSESAYNIRDRHLTYQYRAFGVPDLALKRGLGRDLVIAPYASVLATMVQPARALANLAALEALGALGEYGFRDAVDYTRPHPGRRYALVGNYMAHHVGMSLVALTNVLTDDVWQRRFHAEPLVKGAALLLHERIPRRLVLQDVQTARADEALPDPAVEQPFVRELHDVDGPAPHVALLGRLPYTIMVSHAGAGYSRFEALAVTRWRADGTADDTGQFCYVKDVGRNRLWSAAHQPVCARPDAYRARLATDRVTFERVDGDIETRTEIAVAPQDSAEVRRITVTNTSQVTREIELTSYGEIVLAPPDSDRAHPAFANLFVETEWHAWCSAVTATRRPRRESERPLWCVHVAATGEERVGRVSCETDRARFIGRGRSRRDPMALDKDGALSGTTGSVLDPIFALRARVRLEPGKSASVSFTTLVASSREQAFAMADRYHDPRTVQRALDLAWSATQVELRELGVTPADAAVFQELAGNLLYPTAAFRAPRDEIARNEGPQPLLWSQGISGDWPILLATIDSPAGVPTLRHLFAAHHYWRRRGMMVDLVILNEHPSGYTQDLEGHVRDAMYASNEPDALDKPGGVFLRRGDQLDAATRLMLRATARVHVACDGRTLARVLEEVAAGGGDVAVPPAVGHAAALPRRAERAAVVKAAPAPMRLLAQRGSGSAPVRPSGVYRAVEQVAGSTGPLTLDNGTGGLTPDGAYRIRVRGDTVPPAPWANVIANEQGGVLVTERGVACTWAANSYFYRLTPWANDPVSDPPGDVVYLRDEATGELWSATPAPVRSDLPYTVTHAPGTSTFAHVRAGIATRLTIGIAEEAAVRVSMLRVTNTSGERRTVSVTSYAEWTLGALREHTQHQVRTRFDAEHGAIVAQNAFDPQFAGWVAFSAMTEPVVAHTADRREFVGRNGTLAAPRAFAGVGRAPLSGVTGAALDPCAALQCVLELAPGETREVAILLGAAEGMDAMRATLAAHRDVGRAATAAKATVDAWARRLSVVQVRTPEPSFDAMVNRWTLYQALGCRMWARTALYQSSGAYGFRDQLQDVLAFVYAEPAIARAHILRAAARQFLEGDVQHWWHPQSGRGVRTRFSDDLAWLPYVVDRYVEVTGDATVLDEYVPFLTMRPLEAHEHELYELPQPTEEHGTVYEHCLRALRRACTTGAHGLPLIGIGDWNDGMNRVGVEGRGESVWLAWFLTATLRRFATTVASRGDHATAIGMRAQADAYVAAVEAEGWDGAWYRRAYFDDGTPLGSASSDECRIDAIAQSWSVISGAGDPARSAQAMASLEEHLVDDDARLLLLLTPPFDRTRNDPGYIKGYLPGVRENGAQYTHAALWTVMATALRGDGDRALALYQMINPLMHARTPEEVATYKVEPYVVAADVYTARGQLGRGGWTWYTGSASWMYRVGLESILGFTRRGDRVTIVPSVPAAWPEYGITYRWGTSTYEITVRSPAAVREHGTAMSVDGVALSVPELVLVDDGGTHVVVVEPRGG